MYSSDKPNSMCTFSSSVIDLVQAYKPYLNLGLISIIYCVKVDYDRSSWLMLKSMYHKLSHNNYCRG